MIFEQRFIYDGLTKEEGNNYLNILLHSTEIIDVDLVTMHLKKVGRVIFFSGTGME